KLLAIVENNKTSIYAATTNGLFRSTDSAMSWSQPLVQGDIWSFCAWVPAGGRAAYYAGVFRSGLYTASDPAGPWTNLNDNDPVLPAYMGSPGGENFHVVYADLCPQDPTRIYLALLSGTTYFNVTIYMSDDATTPWSKMG